MKTLIAILLLNSYFAMAESGKIDPIVIVKPYMVPLCSASLPESASVEAKTRLTELKTKNNCH